MKVKELQKTVNVAWSPAQLNSIWLAAGTAAQQLDTSSNSVLEIYSTNLSEPGYDMILKGSQASPFPFHKIVWSPLGSGGQYNQGVIVGGCEGGHLQVYNAAKLLAGEESLMSKQNKHVGPVRALDFNPFQTNLLASGSAESEILIWDLNNTTTPMTPGAKTQPFEDIQNVAWNNQVQHILASVFSTRCIVWDLRKNEPIIKLSDTQSRVRWRALQWHPDIATQLWLASEDDQAPVVQLWDLRYATTPAKTLQIHQRGVLGLSWCPKDLNLMVSCGKDNKIICWNPNSEQGDQSESEIASTIQWYSDVQWCPKNPALIASSSLDGTVSLYSLYGGSQQQVQTSNKIADSFPGMDTFAQAPVPHNNLAPVVYNDLKTPPVWMKQPVGASFGFGGKLVTFNQGMPGIITINQIVTELELVDRSNKLEEVLAGGNYADYCVEKANQMENQHGRYIWYFVKTNFEANPRSEMLNLLGYNSEDLETKYAKFKHLNEDNLDQLTNNMAQLGHATDNNAVFDAIAADHKTMAAEVARKEVSFKIKTGDDEDGQICEALVSGNTEAAVELCLKAGRNADAIIIAIAGGPELLARTQFRYLRSSEGYLSNIISALVTEDWSGVVTQCTIDSWKECLVAILTHSNEQMSALCEQLAERLLNEGGADQTNIENAILCYICAGNIEKLVEIWPKPNISAGGDSNAKLSKDLQELIEVVMLLQKAVELQGRSVGVSGKLAEILSRYAGLLAAQGALTSAVSYLRPSDDEAVEDLRSRLYYSLGYKQAYATPVATNQQPQTNPFKPQPRYSLPNNQVPMPNQQQPAFGSNFANPNMHASSFNAGFGSPPSMPSTQQWVNSPTNQSWNTPQSPPQPTLVPNFKPVQTKPPLGPPPANDYSSQQPARPSSVGSQGSAPSTRNKYLLDPSVQSGPTYGQSNMYAPQMGNNYVQPPLTNFNVAPISAPQVNQFAPQVNQFAPQVNQFAPFVPASTNNFMTGVPPIEVAQHAIPQRNPTPPPGWNDPPPLKTNRQPPPMNNNINGGPTTSLYGNDLNQNGIYDPTQHQQQTFQPPTVFTPSQPQTFQQHPPPTQPFQPQVNFQTQQTPHVQQFSNQIHQQQQQPQQQQQQQQRQATPELPKQKPPLPEEFVYMQTVFNELRQQCVNAASNPQTKRKFDDVAKRLESLYDLLREDRLTPNTLASLNQLVQLVQIGDYANGIGLHTQMVSGPDFAQIASFMPGIKVLLQSAMQLQVYLR